MPKPYSKLSSASKVNLRAPQNFESKANETLSSAKNIATKPGGCPTPKFFSASISLAPSSTPSPTRISPPSRSFCSSFGAISIPASCPSAKRISPIFVLASTLQKCAPPPQEPLAFRPSMRAWRRISLRLHVPPEPPVRAQFPHSRRAKTVYDTCVIPRIKRGRSPHHENQHRLSAPRARHARRATNFGARRRRAAPQSHVQERFCNRHARNHRPRRTHSVPHS